jgi:predicted dehydrogenase
VTRVGLAVVGVGLIGRRHVEAIGQSAGARVAALVDPSPAAADLAAGLGVPWWPALDAMPDGVADGVILATPNVLHVEGGLACIARRLPVLVEKPLATDLDCAARLVEAAEAAGVPLAVGHHRRHNPLVAAARALLDAGAIGRPVAVQAQFWLQKPPEYFAIGWRREPGAGPVLLNAIHDIDLLRHLVGEVAAVQATLSHAARGHAVEDTAVVLLTFANGALGTVSITDAVPAPWSWELGAGENRAYPAAGQPCCLIGGTAASLELPSLRLWRHEGPRGWWSPLSATVAPAPAGDPILRQVEQFAEVIRDGVAPLVPGREGLRTLAVVEAIGRAAALGGSVAPAA